jgi:hypothetical protein
MVSGKLMDGLGSKIVEKNQHICHAETLLFGPRPGPRFKENQLGIKLIPMISTWDQVDPT